MTLWLGLAMIAACEALLFADVRLSNRGAVQSSADLEELCSHRFEGSFRSLARYVAFNITPLAWLGYIVFLEGALKWQSGTSPVRRRPNHFALLALASVFIWCVFDAINFWAGMRAWEYIGMPPRFSQRISGYLLSFATIVPGMLMTGQVLLNIGCFDWARSPRWRMPRWAKWLALLAGVAMFTWPLVHPTPATSLTVWTSLVFFLDPINQKLKRPSMFSDWQNGWYGRTLAAATGGLICGLLWEFWNYWALTKWIYHLPFLGSLEDYRYFQMPVLGLIGFIPFGIECWVMWQTIRIPLDGLVEPLPCDRDLL
ncbi:MAG: hypothetical protein ACREJC_11670 [Tepidisphaeraceae bacterium]